MCTPIGVLLPMHVDDVTKVIPNHVSWLHDCFSFIAVKN
jgi:hypothetical protein